MGPTQSKVDYARMFDVFASNHTFTRSSKEAVIVLAESHWLTYTWTGGEAPVGSSSLTLYYSI